MSESGTVTGDASPVRKIIHIDMDAFYASVEQRDNPELRGKPVAVGGSRERGVVAAASYEARKFGVHSAMPSVTAKRKCPDLIFVKPRFDVYKAISPQIREIFAEYTPIIEPLSLDEAYLDVTENLQGIPLGARRRRADPREDQGRDRPQRFGGHLLQQVPCQARLRSPQAQRPVRDHARDGTRLRRDAAGRQVPRHRPGDEREDECARPVHRARSPQPDAGVPEANFGKSGAYYYWISRGVDERPVRADRIRKSIGAENTFSTDLDEFDALVAELKPLVDKVWRHCETTGNRGRTVTLKIKFADFEIITRSRSVLRRLQAGTTWSGSPAACSKSRCRCPSASGSWGYRCLSLQVGDDAEPQLTFGI